jgi:hypothetical protein
MTNKVLLNNIDHSGLRVIPRASEATGEGASQIPIFPTEFEELQREYPIVFRKDDQGEFQSVILTGLDRDENLFVSEGIWHARYVPAIEQRGPFSIALRDQEAGAQSQAEPMIYVDLDDPRISDKEGEPLFMPHGGNSPYLEHIAAMLRMLYQGLEVSKPMFAAFAELDLIEPITLEIQLNERQQYRLPNVYTIGATRFSQLEGAHLERLHRAGFLRAAYFVLSSLGNMSRLIDLKNQKLA